jgi:hypothetical protein
MADLAYPGELFRDWLVAKGGEVDDAEFADFRRLIDVAFFASLATEERTPVAMDIVVHEQGVKGLAGLTDTSDGADRDDPELAWTVIPIAPRDYTVAELAKIASAAPAPRCCVVVSTTTEALRFCCPKMVRERCFSLRRAAFSCGPCQPACKKIGNRAIASPS